MCICPGATDLRNYSVYTVFNEAADADAYCNGKQIMVYGARCCGDVAPELDGGVGYFWIETGDKGDATCDTVWTLRAGPRCTARGGGRNSRAGKRSRCTARGGGRSRAGERSRCRDSADGDRDGQRGRGTNGAARDPAVLSHVYASLHQRLRPCSAP